MLKRYIPAASGQFFAFVPKRSLVAYAREKARFQQGKGVVVSNTGGTRESTLASPRASLAFLPDHRGVSSC